MHQLLVIWYDKEHEFAKRLSDVFYENKEKPYVMEVFTSGSAVKRRLLEEKKPDLIIFDGRDFEFAKYLEEEYEEICHASWTIEPVADRKGVFKYQAAEKIEKQILKLLPEEHLPKVQGTCGQVRAIGVYSPVGRCGGTKIAIDFCRKKGGIYLGMEEYSSEVIKGHSMDKLLYYIKRRKANIAMHTQLLAEKENGIQKISSPISYFDLRSMTAEDFSWYVKEMKESGLFPYLIADIGTGALSDLAMLNCFDRIIMPVPAEEKCVKIDNFYAVLEHMEFLEIQNKISVIPVSGYGKEAVYMDKELQMVMAAV